jgi:hypothetical protein
MRAPADENVVVFVGPTMARSPRAAALTRRLKVRPPVRRQDIAKLVATGRAPGVIVIVDGVFHHTLAVGHGEICDALDARCRVWGLSSMGAIRAREMAHLGMRGFGWVFERFNVEDDFQDDEVAFLHEPTPPYRPVAEPVVHLRAAIDHLVARGIVRADDAAAVIADLKSVCYGDRTIRGTIEAFGVRARGGVLAVHEEFGNFQRFALKTLDLERFLEERPWLRTTRDSKTETSSVSRDH